MSKAVVIGDGGWGTALALVLLSNGHDVTLWCRRQERLEQMKQSRENKYLKGIPLPDTRGKKTRHRNNQPGVLPGGLLNLRGTMI